jgi:transcriptional regulator with XRE-family HTH domain
MPTVKLPVFDHARLRAWRDETGLRLETVADRSGVSYPYLRALEDQGGNPSGAVCAAVAAVYGKPLAELFLFPVAAGGET